MQNTHTHRNMFTQEQKALIFSALMIGTMLVSLVMVLTNTGPIILGTEMNTNGSVEYLCLGNDCNNMF